MRIVMLSCNTGEGHNSTAKAIQQVLKSRDVECEIVDVLACLSPRFSKFVCNWHARIYKYAPKLWDVSYTAFEKKEMRSDESDMLYELLTLGAPKLKAKLEQGRYDAIVCVHVFSGMMMSELRKLWDISTPCYFVATDYGCYPYVDLCDMDGYFIPAESLINEFAAAGLQREKLIPSGIPVRQEFYFAQDKLATREELRLPKDAIVTLLMCGSMGCGPMRKIARELAEQMPANAEVVAVCGKNEKLYDALSSLSLPGLRVLGYTTKIGAYMDASDIIVTKPGGLSCTEAANKRLPMVFINAVGGCESRNFDFFMDRGCALGSTVPGKVVAQTVALATNPERRAKMRAALERDFTTNSAVLIADVVTDAGRRYRNGSYISGEPVRLENQNNGHSSVEGGCTMENTNKETILNLARSFAGESQARTRYTIYAQQARKEGWEWLARVFEETAANEAVHAEEFLEMLQKLGGCADDIHVDAGYPFQLGTTEENLAAAAAGELHEHDEAYPAFAEVARREGCDEAARLWMQIARIEGVHHNTFLSLKQQLSGGSLTEKETPVTWRCLNCGYTYESTRACDPCPVCHKSAGWQEGELDNKKLITKSK